MLPSDGGDTNRANNNPVKNKTKISKELKQ